ncbi:MAG: DUF4398 domain-containing protein [Pseudomonadaceae bacterium]|nr:MAG: DUF4398 domain-containing protein [Pseudomonadaceae bacterium]
MGFVAALVLVLSACAAPPVAPTQALREAESSIARAEQSRASDYAALELGAAREKLAAANDAVRREDMAQAKRLAQQSGVEAELALAKSQASKAREVNAEMQQSTDSLRDEMQRSSGGAQ